MIALSDIVQAKRRVSPVINTTPFALAPILSNMVGADVYLKKENLQLTGAYKIRGAYNKIASLSDEERARGVIAASAGNHAQGVAYSAKTFGIRAVIVMPEATPLLKVTGTKELGAEVILHGDNYDEAYAHAQKVAQEEGMSFIHPFEDDAVIAGQGTVALEMLDCVNDLDIVVVPIGGGGLISGVASAVKQLDPKIKVIGVTAKGAPAMFESFQAKSVIHSKSVRSIADGIAVRDTSEKNLGHILECVLLERQKLVVEGGGAASIAAIMHHKFDFQPKTKIGAVLSGGNIDVQTLSVIIEKGLIKSARKMIIMVTLVDKPGALMRLTDILRNANANIIKIDYDRTSTTLSYGDANITITLETKGQDHQNEVRQKLSSGGYQFSEIF
jgi:threonine dehydratase